MIEYSLKGRDFRIGLIRQIIDEKKIFNFAYFSVKLQENIQSH
jgi:hypothetical protein